MSVKHLTKKEKSLDTENYILNPSSGNYVKLLDKQLFEAAEKGNTSEVRDLLDRGADIHADNDEVVYLAALSGHSETVELLLDRGVNIHTQYDCALRFAANEGNTETVELLLDRGADIHVYDNEALQWAAIGGKTETVKILLDRGSLVSDEIIDKTNNEEIKELLIQAQRRRRAKPAKVER